jgi:hypothetical protein
MRPQPESTPITAAPVPVLDKIVVAIHGIGPALRSESIRAAVHRFGALDTPPLPMLPLGYFNIGSIGEVCVSRLDVPGNDPLARIGFAEVYWADVTRNLVRQDDTLEESKAWGRTVLGRVRALYERVEAEAKRSGWQAQLTPKDFSMASGVIEEEIETFAVLEKLFYLPSQIGLLDFSIPGLLRDYYSDVQLVAEFQYYRQVILFRFHEVMQEVIDWFRKTYPRFKGDPEIHIVAHSEGSVIAFLALLQALSCSAVSNPGAQATRISTAWITCVRGFMTFGSPIDKHILLWPKLWDPMDLESADFRQQRADANVVMKAASRGRPLTLPRPIKWRNYYDFGDPIGFELDTARKYLSEHACGAFQFTSNDDFGFSRYWVPGAAHVGYWGDDAVFGHFIDDVVLPEARPKSVRKAPPPRSRFGVGIVSTAIPYVLAFLLHAAAVFLLFKAVLASFDFGYYAYPDVGRSVLLLSLLLSGVTVAGRLPRLVKSRRARWWALALLAFLCAALPCLYLLHPGISNFLIGPLAGSPAGEKLGVVADKLGVPAGNLVLVAVAAVVGLSGWLAPRTPRMGRRFLIGSGTLLLAAGILWRYAEAPARTPLWPLVLAGFFFLYLWKLGVMVFDLAFIWHRYIRYSVALKSMRAWRDRRDAVPRK